MKIYHVHFDRVVCCTATIDNIKKHIFESGYIVIMIIYNCIYVVAFSEIEIIWNKFRCIYHRHECIFFWYYPYTTNMVNPITRKNHVPYIYGIGNSIRPFQSHLKWWISLKCVCIYVCGGGDMRCDVCVIWFLFILKSGMQSKNIKLFKWMSIILTSLSVRNCVYWLTFWNWKHM